MFSAYQLTEKKIFEIVMQTPTRFLYSFLNVIFLQVDVLEKECRDLGFGKFVKSVSPACFEIVAQTRARVPYSFPGQMVVHDEEVEQSKTLENTVELERPMFSEVVARPFVDCVGPKAYHSSFDDDQLMKL